MWILREPNKDGGREFSHLTDAYRAFLFWKDVCEIDCEFFYHDISAVNAKPYKLELVDVKHALFAGVNQPLPEGPVAA